MDLKSIQSASENTVLSTIHTHSRKNVYQSVGGISGSYIEHIYVYLGNLWNSWNYYHRDSNVLRRIDFRYFDTCRSYSSFTFSVCCCENFFAASFKFIQRSFSEEKSEKRRRKTITESSGNGKEMVYEENLDEKPITGSGRRNLRPNHFWRPPVILNRVSINCAWEIIKLLSSLFAVLNLFLLSQQHNTPHIDIYLRLFHNWWVSKNVCFYVESRPRDHPLPSPALLSSITHSHCVPRIIWTILLLCVGIIINLTLSAQRIKKAV